jgi:hypothetical protein
MRKNSLNDIWKKVDKTSNSNGCWIYTAAKDNDGYGRFCFDGQNRMAHRIVYQLIYGDIQSNQYICHTCDNPACVNPNHLFLGSPDDNMKDKVAKNRQAKGEMAGNSKLKENQVLDIRKKNIFNQTIRFYV